MISASERHPRQAGNGDRISWVSLGNLREEKFGAVEGAIVEELLRHEQQLDHRSSVSMAWASSSSVARSLIAGSVTA